MSTKRERLAPEVTPKALLIFLALVLAGLSARASLVVFYCDGTNIFAGSDGKCLRPGAGTTETGPKIWRAGNTICGVTGISEGTGFNAAEICRKELLQNGDVDAAISRIETACSNALPRVCTEDRVPLEVKPGVQLGFGFLRSGKPEFRLSQIVVGTNSQGLTISIVRDTQPPWLAWWMAFPTVWESVSDIATEKMWDEKGGFGGLETVLRAQIKTVTNTLSTIGYPIYRMRLGPDGFSEAPLITGP